MTAVFRTAFDYFLFTSLFIAGCALLMVQQTNHLLHLDYNVDEYLLFVFFSTLCSYNFHWFLTPEMESENARVRWTIRHKKLHLILAVIGLVGSAWLFFRFIHHVLWLGGAVVLTFLYSAPKLHIGPFPQLRRIAVGKTLFLTFVWTYVTTVLPLALDGNSWHAAAVLFCLHRFLLIYAICILFDYRDRDYDRKEGVRSMITWFSEQGINRLFAITLVLFAACTAALYDAGFPLAVVGLLFVPAIILVLLYPVAKRNFSDYLYYFVLDGLMMFSALFTAFFSF